MNDNVIAFPASAPEPAGLFGAPPLSGFVRQSPAMIALREMTLDAAMRANRDATSADTRDVLAAAYSTGQRDAFVMALVTSYHPPGAPDPGTATKVVEAIATGVTDRTILFDIAASSGD